MATATAAPRRAAPTQRTAESGGALCTFPKYGSDDDVCGVPAIVHIAVDLGGVHRARLACLYHLAAARTAGTLRGRHHYHPTRCANPNAPLGHWNAAEQANA